MILVTVMIMKLNIYKTIIEMLMKNDFFCKIGIRTYIYLLLLSPFLKNEFDFNR